MAELVGILNITPDSFSGDGLYEKPSDAFDHAAEMSAQGARIIDVGAESTRPHATPIDAAEEWRRLEPVLPALITYYPGRISVDTRHPETAARALYLAASGSAELIPHADEVIINDMSSMTNPAMVKVVADYGARCIIGHIPGNDVHAAHTGELIDDIGRVKAALLERKARLMRAGLRPDHIILDPGIGFGKTPELNWQLLKFAELMPGHEVMVGYSRKRFLGEDRMELEPNLEAGRVAVAAGATYLRVHDVAGHRQLLD